LERDIDLNRHFGPDTEVEYEPNSTFNKEDLFLKTTNFYNRNAASFDRINIGASDYMELFANLLIRNSGKYSLILDAGGGNGNNSRSLASYGFRITFNDISQNMIDYAKNNLKGYRNVKFLMPCNMLRLAFPSCTFDGIIASFSLIHMLDDDIVEALIKFNRFLKIHGLIYIAMQCYGSNESYRTDSYLHKIAHPIFDEVEYINVYSKQKTREIMNKCGFSDVKLDESRPPRENELPFDKHFCIAKKVSNVENIL
jgi:ubiquinone/menaquinone biosynthesis C-methylase UbiE